jgi:hypothetical protein
MFFISDFATMKTLATAPLMTKQFA